MENGLKQRLVNRLKQAGAYTVRVADSNIGFEHALEGRHPLDVWEMCKSVIVFAIARPPQNNNTYIGVYAPWSEKQRYLGPVPQDLQSIDYAMQRLSRLFVSSVTLEGVDLLQTDGYNTLWNTPQAKLAAFEAGIGVYGRSGLIIHPKLGNRIVLGTILTDAVLEPDRRMEGFEPCEGCDRCIEMCPAKAFDLEKPYPHSWSRKTCTEKRVQISAQGFYCHNCFAVCPAGKYEDEELVNVGKSASFFAPHRASNKVLDV
ncbi:MAG: epoxyqueuosine reductase [Chloroflexi bacterium]|nr:epoxyqueuosine reductase [Chloroflexota bacterium]